ncbi:MAG: Holliday junction DNA helicase RuvA [Parcubacteria group bacterium CG1_02_42_13]|uniref:Holliday junction branch migration complex subunit RuvA n=1 Tax=Candidatus Colwellbacteria bacterium CG23_combo_of_CG06-09_8_20_14_all_42_19 TaxID=1974541 RepID=A0A2H0APQ9_9BACT|nr:MAG: Holliday junction DNA helicase RuvA [Parcubacteria group bacterium CG1_02_42_13]PIP46588.1 MAG: Holliday junction branch migration protein RuvA [Candidatus Colwellbacteria bacterium CG23_combo_of_CG06-09_8_20_14_all_42_19]
MIYSVSGKLKLKNNAYAVVAVGGLSFKVSISLNTYKKLPEVNEEVTLMTHFHVREDDMNLYGFLEERELNLFESLISVSGIGPKTALNILSAAPVDRLSGAIAKGETDLIQKSYGIGKKTAERIVMELKDKIFVGDGKGEEVVRLMESDSDVYDALISLGYAGRQVKEAISKIDPKLKSVDDRLRDALKKMKG